MNIFALSRDPKEAAKFHVDRHVVKMIIEYAQLLSTAHRMIDGEVKIVEQPNGRKKQFRLLPGEQLVLEEKWIISEPKCYMHTHFNHPCAVWCRQSGQNYLWLFSLFEHLNDEFVHRYKKPHQTWLKLNEFLRSTPTGIPQGDLTEFPQAMPDEFKDTDSVVAYRNYVYFGKGSMLKWRNRTIPVWAPPSA